MMTNIPVNKILSTERNKLSKLEKIIKDKIIGQDEAVSKVVKSIQRNRAGLVHLTDLLAHYFSVKPV